MKETPQQYTQRILGYQRGLVPMKVLAESPKRLARLLQGVPTKTLAKRPHPKQWAASEILAHLADAELVSGFRMRLILGSNRTPIQAFDQDSWAVFSRYRAQDPHLSFEAYKVERERNIRLLKGIPKTMWKYYGMHSERGKETIKRLTEMMAGHDINHIDQIERCIRPSRVRS